MAKRRQRRTSAPPPMGDPDAQQAATATPANCFSCRVAVTGACGYSGRALVRRLLNLGFEVVAGDIAPPPPPTPLMLKYALELDPRAEFRICDVTSRDDCDSLVAGGVRTVFHIGALVPYNLPVGVTREQLMTVNVGGTRNMLAAAVAAGVRSFVYCSSTGAVFAGEDIAGADESFPMPDVTPSNHGRPRSVAASLLRPLEVWLRGSDYWNDAYSESKALAERAVSAAGAAGGGMATLSLRPNGIWGPGENHHIPKALVLARLGLSGVPFCGGSLTDWTHREDLAEAFVAAHRALSGAGKGGAARRARLSGRAFFVTAPWKCHTTEFFSPLLAGLGFSPPFDTLRLVLGEEQQQQTKGRAPWEYKAYEEAEHASDREVPAYVVDNWGCASREPSADGLNQPDSRRSSDDIKNDFRLTDLPVAHGYHTIATQDRSFGSNGLRLPGIMLAHLRSQYIASERRRWVDSRTGLSSNRSINALVGTSAAQPASSPLAHRDPFSIIVTSPPPFSLPSSVLYPVALLLQLAAAVARPLRSIEPFLTLGDVRKVAKHNYYSSAAAQRELDWQPVVAPVDGLREAIAYYRELGYDGAVAPPRGVAAPLLLCGLAQLSVLVLAPLDWLVFSPVWVSVAFWLLVFLLHAAVSFALRDLSRGKLPEQVMVYAALLIALSLMLRMLFGLDVHTPTMNSILVFAADSLLLMEPLLRPVVSFVRYMRTTELMHLDAAVLAVSGLHEGLYLLPARPPYTGLIVAAAALAVDSYNMAVYSLLRWILPLAASLYAAAAPLLDTYLPTASFVALSDRNNYLPCAAPCEPPVCDCGRSSAPISALEEAALSHFRGGASAAAAWSAGARQLSQGVGVSLGSALAWRPRLASPGCEAGSEELSSQPRCELTLSDAWQVLRTPLMTLLAAALLCHAVQGVLAARWAWRWRTNALGWALQCGLYGFPSTALLVRIHRPGTSAVAEAAASRTVAGCIAGFLGCIPLVFSVRTLWPLLGWGVVAAACAPLAAVLAVAG